MVSPITNLSNIEECGLDIEYFDETYDEVNCSLLIGNPCVYNIRVGVVYKGDYRVREREGEIYNYNNYIHRRGNY